MPRRDTGRTRTGYIPLFWRLFVPNAAVLLAACIVLIVDPADGRVVALVGGLTIMLAVNVVLMRRAFAPLARLTRLMDAVDPLQPGRRLPVLGPESEVARLTEAFNRMLDRLETERRESAYRALAAQEAERRRVAAELHDEIGQRLTALILQLDMTGRGAPEGVRDDIAAASGAAKDTLENVRGLAHRLRPEVLTELGLVPALRNLCNRISNGTGVVIHRSFEDIPALSEDAEVVVYRVAQESLTNVLRHAGARKVEVGLHGRDGRVELLVRDDGAGLPAETAAASAGGIRGMRERALLIGGRLEIESHVGDGTAVRLELPKSA